MLAATDPYHTQLHLGDRHRDAQSFDSVHAPAGARGAGSAMDVTQVAQWLDRLEKYCRTAEEGKRTAQ
jgi:hypothetical protein